MICKRVMALCVCCVGFSLMTHAASTATRLEKFSKAWPANRKGYRTDGDQSWKVYASILRDLVASKDVAGIRKGLSHKNKQVRALCARALGYLNAKDAVADLGKMLKEDRFHNSRLQAADALGMIGGKGATDALLAGRTSETKNSKKGDVLLHIAIALKRKTKTLEKEAVADLLSIKDAEMDTAIVGKPAPGFSMQDADGKTFNLSDYRGKKNVVLIFIYGDG